MEARSQRVGSPRGRTISSRQRTERIWVLSVLTALLAAGLTLLSASPGAAAFPGGNGKLAFSAQVTENGSGGVFKIFVQNPDGSGETALSPPGANDLDPTWSPDGDRLAFFVHGNGGQIGVMNADGSNRQLITGGAGQQDSGSQPAWSPSGDQIVFTRPLFGGIYVMNADGTSPTVLTTSGASPAWSPDGQTIAFTRSVSGSNNIFTMNADGSNVTALTSATGGPHFDNPDWSPDGTQLVVSCPDGENGNSICVMNSDGSELTTITSGNNRDYVPVWSPEGDQIAFDRYTNSRQDVWIINADGTDGHALSDGASANIDGNGISWQPSTVSATTTTSSSTSTTSVTTTIAPTTTTIATTSTTRVAANPASEVVCTVIQRFATSSFAFFGRIVSWLLLALRCKG